MKTRAAKPRCGISCGPTLARKSPSVFASRSARDVCAKRPCRVRSKTCCAGWTCNPARPYFTPAGTVHAIGAGIALCEIQQHSDVTYRLYDYGRPRELHLEKAIQVTDTSAHSGQPVPLPLDSAYFIRTC